jgi:N-acetyltransferase 10
MVAHGVCFWLLQVRDLIPTVAHLFFFGRLGPELRLSQLQCAILLGMGLQSKTIDQLAKETTLPAGQLLAMFNKSVRKISKCLQKIFEDEAAREVDHSLNQAKSKSKNKLKKLKSNHKQTLANDLQEGAAVAQRQQEDDLMMKSVPEEFMEYAVPEGIEEVLASRKSKKLGGGVNVGSVSVKRKRDEMAEEEQAKKLKLAAAAAENKKRRNKKKKLKKKARDKEKK